MSSGGQRFGCEFFSAGVWTRSLGPGLQEGTPLVHDDVMYVPTTGDDILAVDAKTGDVLWEYQRKLPDGVQPKRRLSGS